MSICSIIIFKTSEFYSNNIVCCDESNGVPQRSQGNLNAAASNVPLGLVWLSTHASTFNNGFNSSLRCKCSLMLQCKCSHITEYIYKIEWKYFDGKMLCSWRNHFPFIAWIEYCTTHNTNPIIVMHDRRDINLFWIAYAHKLIVEPPWYFPFRDNIFNTWTEWSGCKTSVLVGRLVPRWSYALVVVFIPKKIYIKRRKEKGRSMHTWTICIIHETVKLV